MRTGIKFAALTLLAVAWTAPPVTAQGDETPKLLYPHPDRELSANAGPFWIAAVDAFNPDHTVREGSRIGQERAEGVAWYASRNDRVDEPGTALDCYVPPRKAAGRRALVDMPGRVVFLPGDFTGWVAASEAVVLGTVAELVPGFDVRGRPNTLAVLEDVEHLYPSRAYSHLVKYVILPYARFVAGGTVFCHPWSESQQYYASVGDRLLIAADLPADSGRLSMTVQAMSRVVQVQDDDTLITYGQSEFSPVTFVSDFPEILDEAKTRTWGIWQNGMVDFAASLGLEEFTQLWKGMKKERAALESRGCDIDQSQFHSGADGWSFSADCPDSTDDDPQEP